MTCGCKEVRNGKWSHVIVLSKHHHAVPDRDRTREHVTHIVHEVKVVPGDPGPAPR